MVSLSGNQLVDVVRRLVESGEERTGRNILVIPGPNGVWRVRTKQKARQVDLRVYPPPSHYGTKPPLYSLNSLCRLLGSQTCRRRDSSPPVNRELAARIIQNSICSHIFFLCFKSFSDEETMLRKFMRWLLLSYRTRRRVVFSRSTSDRAFLSVHKVIPMQVTSCVVEHFPVDKPTPEDLIVITNPILVDIGSRALDHNTVVIKRRHIGPVHSRVIQQRFNIKWLHMMTTLLTESVSSFSLDVYNTDVGYVGGMILSFYLAMLSQQTVVVCNIESFFTKHRMRGYGKEMFCALRKVTEHVATGRGCTLIVIVAQCLKIKFWEGLMDRTSTARSLVIQICNMHPATHLLYTECEPRCIISRLITST
jgi:hypothetical protein